MKKPIILITSILLAISAGIWAENSETELLQVTVTAASGRSVLIDHGRNSGLVPGMRVNLFPPGLGLVPGYLQNVSADSARVELPPGTPLPAIGSIGEVEIPSTSDAEDEESNKEEDSEEHPPWTRELKVRDPDEPLLAPFYRDKAKDREPTINGHLFTHFNYTMDRGEDRELDYYLGRVGVSGTATNLFNQGGQLNFRGEGNLRGVNRDQGDDDSETRFRLDRLSYAVGGHAYSDFRGEVGRFYSRYVPELGLVDGVEGAVQLRNGISVGLGLGSYPLPFTEREEGDDVGFHAFVEYESEADHALTAIAAYQKTWHRGDEDRDLVVGRLNVRPTETIWLHGSVKADLHGSDDTLEEKTIEVSQAWFQARFMPDRKKGASVSFSHYSWPELKRAEFQGLPDDLFTDGYIERTSLYGWFRPTDNVRVSARGNYWSDQDNTGNGGELGLDWTNIAGHRTSLHGNVSYTEATFNDGIGFRGEVRQNLKIVDLFAGYQQFNYSQNNLISGDEDYVRQTVRAGVNWSKGRWYNSLSSDYYFGDGESSIGVMLFSDIRF